MSDSNDNQEFLALQKEGESDTKTADHTEVSDPNSEGVQEDTEFIENNQKSGDRKADDDAEEQQESGGGDDNTQQQESSGGGDDSQEQSSGGDSGDSGDSGEQAEEGGEGEEGGETKKKSSSKQENVDSIPKAGGERLGEKHWGESKIVPEVPKEKGEEGEGENVSSSDGQPDQETKDNTARNTGGGGDSGSADQGEKSLIDKIKDKLPIGGNKE